MPDVLIRNVDPSTVEALKEQARSHGRSMQAEARAILEAEVERRRREESFWERAAEIRRRIGRAFDDSTPYMAETREYGYRDDDEG